MNKRSLGKRILIMFSLILPLPLLIDAGMLFHLSFSNSKKLFLSEMKAHAIIASSDLQDTLTTKSNHLKMSANILSLQDERFFSSPEKIQTLLANLADTEKTLFIFTSPDHVLSSAPLDPILTSFLKKNSFLSLANTPSQRSLLVTCCFSPNSLSSSSLVITTQVTSHSCKSALLSSVNPFHSFLQMNSPYWFAKENLPIQGPFFLNPEGEILYTQTSSPIDLPLQISLENLSPDKKARTNISLSPYSHSKDFYQFYHQGKKHIGFFSQIPLPLIPSAFVYVEKQAIISHALHACLISFISYGTALFIGIIFIIALCITLAGALKDVKNQMLRMEKGDLKAHVSMHPLSYEINLLGKAFNHSLHLLLVTMEEAEKEQIERATFQKEWDLIKPLREQLLLSSSETSLEICHNGKEQPAGIFLTAFSYASTSNTFFALGILNNNNLSSCLYGVSLRSVLLSCASLHPDLDQISSAMQSMINDDSTLQLKNIPLMLGFFEHSKQNLTFSSPPSLLLALQNFSTNPPVVSLLNENFFSQQKNFSFAFTSTDRLLIITRTSQLNKNILNMLSQKVLYYLKINPKPTLATLEKELGLLTGNRLKTTFSLILIKPKL